MSPNRLAGLAVLVLAFGATSFGQVNELSATFGRTFVSTQSIQGANFFNPNVRFGNEETVGLNYARLFKSWAGMGFRAEVPFAFVIDMDLNSGTNIPENYKAFYLAPSFRTNFFNSSSVTPWVSFGGGFAHYRPAGHGLYTGVPFQGSHTTSGALQFGVGFDVWPWHRWGFRFEARDFNSGMPDLGVDVGRTRQNNYYVGGGVIRRF